MRSLIDFLNISVLKQVSKALLIIVCSIAASGLFMKQISAAQCTEPGCCGYNLRVYQWSCQQSTTHCQNWQEPGWLCPNGGPLFPEDEESECNANCQNSTCIEGCAGGWANQCVISHYDQACTEDTAANSCTAEVNLQTCTSQNGGTSCSVATTGSETRGCWVTSPPDATPDPSAPPPTGGGTTCWRCSNNQCVENTTNEPCGCGACTTLTARKAIILFEDTNENTIWEPDIGEKRIVSNTNCLTGNTQYVPGAEIRVDGEVLPQNNCDIMETEYPDACTDTYSCTWNSGSYWTPNAITTVLNLEGTCFDQQSCSCGGGCNWHWYCQSESAEGVVCRQDSRYCENYGTFSLRSGPVKIALKETGQHNVVPQLPAGWRRAAGSPTYANWTTTNGSCDGLLQIGIVPDREKWCRIDPPTAEMANTGSGNSTSFRVTGYSTQAAENVGVIITTKSSTGNAPTSQALPSTPPGMVHNSYLGTDGITRHYYRFNSSGCVTGSGNTCQSHVVASGLPVGQYYVFCSLDSQNPIRCSGNPNCTYEDLNGQVNCNASGYLSCSATGVYNGINYTYDDNAVLDVVCAPSCTPACGQPNGCNTGVNCGTSNTGAPPIPVPMASQNITVNISQVKHFATITWTAGTSTPTSGPTSQYDLVIAQQGGAVQTQAQAALAFDYCFNTACPADGATTCDTTYNGTPIRCMINTATANPSLSYQPQATIGNRIRFFARATNLSCTAFTGSYMSAFSLGRDYTLVQSVSGNFYSDANASGTPFCSGVATPTTPPGANSELVITPPVLGFGTELQVSGDTNYSISNVPYSPSNWVGNKSSLELVLDNDPSIPQAQVVCSCPTDGSNGCTYVDSVNSPQSNLHFYLTTVDLSTGPWWQTVNGLLYAALGDIISVIPEECKDGTSIGACVPYLITQDPTIVNDSLLELSAGIPMSGSGDVAGASKTVWLTQRNPQARTSEATEHTQLPKEDFAYFQSKVDYANLQTLPSLIGLIQEPPAIKTFYKHAGNLRIQPGATPWRIAAGETLVIFVEGSLTFVGEFSTSDILTHVEQGGFLAFIVDDSIIFDSNVGNVDSFNASPTIEGVYIADKTITVEAAAASNVRDKHFVGAGTFVAWVEDGVGNGFVFNRNYADSSIGALENKSYPTETFIFRPDLTSNMPDELKSTSVFWQEVN